MGRYLVLSDIHGSRVKLEKIISVSPPVDAVLLAGDITHKGGYGETALLLDLIRSRCERILGVPGNLDTSGVLQYLLEHKYSIHRSGVTAGEIGIFGVGGSNHTPLSTPMEWSEEEIGRFLAEGYEAVRGAKIKILVSHVPPENTKLDRLWTGGHAGSSAVRDFLLEHDLAACVCGHIHEAAGEDQVGETRCYNVGAVRDGRYALLDFDPNGRAIITSKRL